MKNEKLAALKSVVETKENKLLIQKYKEHVSAAETDKNGETLYCICRRPDNGELMVACDGCDEWFHFKCMEIPLKYEKLVNNYFCPFCDRLFDRGKTLWKRKCLLEECWLPISISGNLASKYCSPEHGKDYLRLKLLNRLEKEESAAVSKSDMAKVLFEVSGYDDFVKLGTSPPKETDNLPDHVKLKINALRQQISALDEQCNLLTVQKQRLNAAKEKSKIINDEIFKLNTAQEDELEASGKNKKKKKKRRKDICGYDFNDINDTDKTYTQLLDLGISEHDFLSQYREAEENQDTQFLGVCIKEKSRCYKHSYWYDIKLDSLQIKTSLNMLEKLELEDKIKNLVVMGLDFLENV